MKGTIIFTVLALWASISTAQTGYTMAGPYETVARDGQYAYTKAGSERDMWTAWQYALQGKRAEAAAIVNAYAKTLQRFDGHDAPLCAIQGYWLLRSMTALKDMETADWEAMVRRAMLPMMEKFDADSPYANGNWGAIVNRLRMACAIFLGDSALYRASVRYYLAGNDNGSLPNYIHKSGQCQETGRDQAHVQLGLGALCDLCDMAWGQGDDLWGALDNRLMRGLEYTARYNLGHEVPFETWQDCTGLYSDWTVPGAMQRGHIRCIYDRAYEHYTSVKRQPMPYVKRLLDLQHKAEREGKITRGMEADVFTVKGVKESPQLHQLFTYSAPEGAPLKHDYDVYVQSRGSKEWKRIDTYMAKVNAPVGNSTHKLSEISYAQFDFTGNVQVKVVCRGRKYKSVRVRPDYRGVIARALNDSTVQFMLFQPENLSVEFDGDITDNLLLFTSKPPVSRQQAEREAKAQGRTFKYYAPGFYTEDTVRVASNTTVYLAPGSYFTGTFAIEDAQNVSIVGRGIARPENGYEGCHVHRSQNVVIDGLTVNTCPVGGSNGVTLRDVRSVSFPAWGDGLNVFASQNVLYDRVFCRNSDDCTTAYATRKGFSGDCRNVTMRNSTLWADVAHPIFIGLHGNAERGDTIENLRYENIDILCQSEPQVDYQGCMAINCGDNNLVRNVTFDNIRVEQIHQGSLIQVKVGYNRKYCTAPGRGVENVTFRNVRYNGTVPNLSVVSGYDSCRRVSGITFEGVKINGRLLHDNMEGKPKWYSTADYVPMYVGAHVDGLVFSPGAGYTMTARSLDYCSAQLNRALEALRPYDFTLMPRNILSGGRKWNLRKASPEEWCSGFWPGVLWMAFGYNKSEAVSKAAKGYTDALLPVVARPVYDHDLGFIAINAFIKGYEASKNETYRAAALRAADSLATLFNPMVGTLLSWPRHVKDYGGHNTIMDNIMNLELLFWAANHGGSPKLRDIAVRHAETTMRNNFRSDGSNCHVAVYNPKTGELLRTVTHQGYSDTSMWSRGQAWAIYGYTMVYRFTRDPRFLAHARKVADIYIKRLRETSDDMVPRWDMDAPDDVKDAASGDGNAPANGVKKVSDGVKDATSGDGNALANGVKKVSDGMKDASAACIVASALLELDGYAPHCGYDTLAVAMLRDLGTARYQSREANVSFLLHSTGHRPAGSEIDASIVYADYYYLEALTRLLERSK